MPLDLLIEHLYLVPEGVFNQITGIMATYLLVFLTFGTLLRRAGGDQVFMELAVDSPDAPWEVPRRPPSSPVR